MNLLKTLLVGLLSIVAFSCQKSQPDYWKDDGGDNGGGSPSNADKPRYIWIDAAANFPDFANSKENIARDLTLAKNAGFTDVVVDVRPTSGDVLFKTDKVEQVKFLYAWVSGAYSKVERTATWDYLQAFVDEAHKLGLKIHAAINTFVGGNTMNGGTGFLYRDLSKQGWATMLNTSGGIVSSMQADGSEKFLNPVNEEVQTFLCDLLKDLAKYDLDGIFLDRGRFQGLQSDFSDYTLTRFRQYLGNVDVSAADILSPGATALPATYTPYLTRWLEFRAKVIYDFMTKARNAVKSVNSSVKFGVYVGGWYSSYYENGVNWASQKYNTSTYYKWATANYKNFGFAGIMDQMLIGAYASPLNVYGNGEWTMQGFCALAKDKTKGDCPIVAGGPDVGNWDPNNLATQEQENEAIVNSVKACMDVCDGYFLFDMIHLKLANQWQYAKQGIEQAIK